jgi:glycine C-acetyltransferase
MPHDRLETALQNVIDQLDEAGTAKRHENVISSVVPAQGGKGPRYLVEGQGDRPFLRMNSNNYLGLCFHDEVVSAGEAAVREFGVGPGAVRFISGTWSTHVALERRLAEFHQREAAAIFSSAYATIMGILPCLITEQTAVISDELNHNCIINAIRLAQPAEKRVYQHLDLTQLASHLEEASVNCNRAIVVTDGVFSMRGDHAPLDTIMELAQQWDYAFDENVLVIVDDSHGVGAFGDNGRGTEEITASDQVDLLVGTLGKSFGVNGGYVAGCDTVVSYIREMANFYIYSNPIGVGEAAAALKAVNCVDSPAG